MPGVAELGVRASVLGLTSFRAGMATMKREAATAHASFGAFGRGASQTTGILNRFSLAVQNTGTSMRFLGNQMTNIGLRATLIFSAPLLAAGAAIVSTGSKFEDELVKINTLVGVSKDKIEEWREVILKLAPTLGTLPVELAKSLFVVTSSGIREGVQGVGDYGDAWEVVEEAAKSAKIGLGDAETTARLISAVMQSYGEDVLSAARANEILVATVREGSFETTTLSKSLGRVIGIASALNVSFEEVGAFIATFTRTNVGADVAVTSLRTTLSAMIKPTQQSEEELAKIGLSMRLVREAADDVNTKLARVNLSLEDFKDAVEEGKVRGVGLTQVLLGLSRAYEGDIESMGKVIGSQRGLAAVLALTSGFAEDYEKVLESITNSHGIVGESFEEVQKTLSFGWSAFKAQVDVLGQRIAVVLIPILNELLAKIAPVIAAMADFAKEHPGFVRIAIAIGAITAVIGPLLIVVGLLISSWGTVIQFGGQILAMVFGLGSAFGLLTPVLLAAGAAFAGIAAIVAATIPRVRALMMTFTEVRVPREAAESIEEFVGATKRIVDDGFGNLVKDMFDWGANIVIQFANGIISAIIYIVNALTAVAQVIAKWLSPGSPPAILPDLTNWGTSAMQSYMDGWELADFDVFDKAANKIETFLRALGDKAAEQILAVRRELTELVDEFRRTGQIATESFSAFDSAIGFSSSVMHDYIRNLGALESATEAVAIAQEKLTDIQKEFSDVLDPIDKRLAEIDAVASGIKRDRRREELLSFIADPFASEDAKRLSGLELEKLDLEEEKESLLLQKAAATDAAQAELALAQTEQQRLETEIELQEKLLGFFEKNNSLVNEMKDAVKNLASAIGDLSGSGGFENVFGGPDTGLFDIINKAIEDAKDKVKAFIDEALAPLKAKWEELKVAFDLFAESLVELIEAVRKPGAFGNLVKNLKEIVRLKLGDMAEPLSRLAKAFSRLGLALFGIFFALGTGVKRRLELLKDTVDINWTGVVSAVADAFETVADALERLQVEILRELNEAIAEFIVQQGKLPDKSEETNSSLRSSIAFMGDYAASILDAFGASTDLGKSLNGLIEFFSGLGKAIASAATGLFVFLTLLFATPLAGFFAGFLTSIAGLPESFDIMTKGIETLLDPKSSLGQKLEGFGLTVWGVFVGIGRTIEKFMAGNFSFLGNLLDTWTKGKSGELIKNVKDTIHEIFSLKFLEGVMEKWLDLLVGGMFEGLGEAVNGTLKTIMETYIVPALQLMKKGVIEELEAVFSTWTFKEGLSIDWGGLWSGMKKSGKGSLIFLAGMASFIVETFVGLAKGVAKTVQKWWDELVFIFKWASDLIVGKSIVPDMLKAILKVFNIKLGELYDFLFGWVPTLTLLFQGMSDDAVAWFEDLFTRATEQIDLLTAWIKEQIDLLIAWLTNDGTETGFGEMIDKISTKLIELKTAMLEKIGEAITDSKTKIQTELVDKASGLGQSFVDGIIAGIASKVDGLIAAAASMAGRAWQAAKDAVGFDSPAKKFIELGEGVVSGFTVGIEANTSSAEKQMVDFAKRVQLASQSALEQGMVQRAALGQMSSIQALGLAPRGQRPIEVSTNFGDVAMNNGVDAIVLVQMIESALIQALRA